MEQKFNIHIYEDANEAQPFTQWLGSFADRNMRARIKIRLERVAAGNWGDYKAVGDGVLELRISFGAGYRIYFAAVDDKLILLLCAGDKSSQVSDIQKAKKYWFDYQGR